MIDFQKLKREWKTFALAAITTVIGLWDSVVAYGYDYTSLIKEEYRMYVIPALGVAFLALRKWSSQPETVEPEPVPEVEASSVSDK